jgi:hypothetical protein
MIVRGETSCEVADGELITIDGSRGLVYAGALDVEAAPISPQASTLAKWTDELRPARVYVLAADARTARMGLGFGADGVVASGAGAVIEGTPVIALDGAFAGGNQDCLQVRAVKLEAVVAGPIAAVELDDTFDPVAVGALPVETLVVYGPGALRAAELGLPQKLIVATAPLDIPAAKLASARSLGR